VSVVCCHIEVFATDRSLVQGKHTECGVSLNVIRRNNNNNNNPIHVQCVAKKRSDLESESSVRSD
jgi:hypothetical protein